MSQKEQGEKGKGERETVTVIPETMVLTEGGLYDLDGVVYRAGKAEKHHGCDQCALQHFSDHKCFRFDCKNLILTEVK